MNTNHEISKLDDLIVTTIDSIKGYEHSAGHVENGSFTAMFGHMADERRRIVTMLQERSRALGGTPADYGSAAATLHRRVEDLRRALGGGDAVVLEEIERGENYLIEEFDRVIDDAHISDETRSLVRQCHDAIVAGQDRVHALKREFELAA